MKSFSHVIVHRIRQIDNVAICHPCNVVVNCLEMWHIPVLAGFGPVLGLVSSLVPRLPSASCSSQNQCWVSTRVLISSLITYLPVLTFLENWLENIPAWFVASKESRIPLWVGC